MIRHPLNRADLDLTALKNELETRLGRRVELLTTKPRGDQPGELILEEPSSQEHLDVDPAIVEAAIAATAAPKSNEQQFLAEFDASPNVASQLLALRNYVARQVGAAEKERQAREHFLDHMRYQLRGQVVDGRHH